MSLAGRNQSTTKAQPAHGSVLRRRLEWGLLTCLLLFAAAQSYGYVQTPGRLPLRVIEVSGEFKHLQRGEIEDAVAAAIDGGFFDVDMRAVRAAVQQMAWVDSVSVRRIWPDTLHIAVTEQLPLARWGESALVNLRGEVFHPQTLASVSGLPRLHGPDGSAPRVVTFYSGLLAALGVDAPQVVSVELDSRRDWWIGFADGLRLSLGQHELVRRIADFRRIYPRLAGDPTRRPQRVDMRYEHGFAVEWMPPAAPDAERAAG